MLYLIMFRRLSAPVPFDGTPDNVDDGGVPAMLVQRRVRRWRSARFHYRRGPN